MTTRTDEFLKSQSFILDRLLACAEFTPEMKQLVHSTIGAMFEQCVNDCVYDRVRLLMGILTNDMEVQRNDRVVEGCCLYTVIMQVDDEEVVNVLGVLVDARTREAVNVCQFTEQQVQQIQLNMTSGFH